MSASPVVVRLEPRGEVLRRILGRFAAVPDDVSLSDELLASDEDRSSTDRDTGTGIGRSDRTAAAR